MPRYRAMRCFILTVLLGSSPFQVFNSVIQLVSVQVPTIRIYFVTEKPVRLQNQLMNKSKFFAIRVVKMNTLIATPVRVDFQLPHSPSIFPAGMNIGFRVYEITGVVGDEQKSFFHNHCSARPRTQTFAVLGAPCGVPVLK